MATSIPPEMQAPMGAETPAAPAKTVCITANPDGSFSVGDHEAYMAQQGGGEEMGEMGEAPAMGAEMPAKPGMTPAASIDEALDLARQMLQDDGRSAEEQMMAGYAKGKPAMAKPSPQQLFGE